MLISDLNMDTFQLGIRHALRVRFILVFILSSRKRYVKMRESLVRFRSLVHMYVSRKRYIKVHVCLPQNMVFSFLPRGYNLPISHMHVQSNKIYKHFTF